MVSCASARGYALGLTSDIFLELRESDGGAEGQQSSVPGIDSEERRGFRGADDCRGLSANDGVKTRAHLVSVALEKGATPHCLIFKLSYAF